MEHLAEMLVDSGIAVEASQERAAETWVAETVDLLVPGMQEAGMLEVAGQEVQTVELKVVGTTEVKTVESKVGGTTAKEVVG